MTERNVTTQRTRGAVIYTRVSTGEQDKHGTSPETQLASCRAKAQALGLPIVAEHYDGGVSGGFLLTRKEFQSAIADIQAGHADTLICPNISRYSRDVEHQQSVKKAVKAAGGRLVFCDMDFDDTPEGDLNFDIQGSFAAYERKVIRARTMRGRRKRAEEGQQPTRTTPPLGYHIVTKVDVLRGDYPAEQLGRYIIVEPAASLARNIFGWYASGQYSLAEIAKKFHADGTPTVRGGKIWHPSTLSSILTNPVYKGQAVFGRVEKRMEEGRIGQPHPVTGRPLKQPYQQKLAPAENQVWIDCPALVAEELWDAAQSRLVSNRLGASGNPRRVRMLAGRVHCPNCGGAMTYQPQKKSSKNPAIIIPANYTCFQHIQAKRLQGETFCDAKTYRVSIIECAVTTAILKAARSPASLAAAMQAHQASASRVPQKATDPKQEMADIYKALEQVDAQQAATVQAQIAGIMAGASPDAYAEAFAAIAARRKDLEQRRGELKRQTSTELPSKTSKRATQAISHAAPDTFLEKAYVVLTSPDVPEVKKRDMVGLLVESVTCHKGGARIEFLPGLFGMDGMVADRKGDGQDAKTLQTIKTVSIGDLSSSIVHPREVYKDAVLASAASIIVAHNHPSGDPTPSAEDVAVTKRLIQSGEIMGIDLLDHIVLGDGVFVSLKERGLI